MYNNAQLYYQKTNFKRSKTFIDTQSRVLARLTILVNAINVAQLEDLRSLQHLLTTSDYSKPSRSKVSPRVSSFINIDSVSAHYQHSAARRAMQAMQDTQEPVGHAYHVTHMTN